MNMLKRQTYLGEPVEHMVLTPVLQVAAILVSLFVLILYTALEVSAVSEVHDDAELALFSFIHLSEPHDVGMIEHFQNFGFSECLIPFFFGHSLNIDLFDDCQRLVALAFDEVGRTEGADSESLDLLVSFVTFFVLHNHALSIII